MSKSLKNVNFNNTAQVESARADQVQNNAGGYVFVVSDDTRLDRFLMLGTDGGTYYTKESDLTKQNVDFIHSALRKNASNVIARTIAVSDQGRARSNSPALFVLALAMNTDGVDKSMVRAALPKVARTSTHLFEYAQYLKNLGGWGRAKRASIADWYETKSTQGSLAMQLVKYRQRNGWTHRDLLRLAHPANVDSNLVNFALGKSHESTGLIAAFERIQVASSINDVLAVLNDNPSLPWETAPTQFHNELKFWKKLFQNDALGQTALLRNVTRFAKLGAFDDMVFAAEYAKRLSDPERIRKGRVHPVSFLLASVTYKEGQTDRNSYGRSKTWQTNGKISAALEKGYYNAFKFVEPANKRTLVALDVSGSMSSPAMGIDLSCAQVGGAVAMTIARTEPYSEIRGFTSTGNYHRGDTVLTDLGIDESTSLSNAMRNVQRSNFGGTDCALPMLWAKESNVEIDTFVVITDNETWAGRTHPFQALKQYRKHTGIDARLAVFGVSASPFTIADPNDRGMMDFVGFDSNAPYALANFSAGRL